jgi:hypothetical protein
MNKKIIFFLTLLMNLTNNIDETEKINGLCRGTQNYPDQ